MARGRRSGGKGDGFTANLKFRTWRLAPLVIPSASVQAKCFFRTPPLNGAARRGISMGCHRKPSLLEQRHQQLSFRARAHCAVFKWRSPQPALSDTEGERTGGIRVAKHEKRSSMKEGTVLPINYRDATGKRITTRIPRRLRCVLHHGSLGMTRGSEPGLLLTVSTLNLQPSTCLKPSTALLPPRERRRRQRVRSCIIRALLRNAWRIYSPPAHNDSPRCKLSFFRPPSK
jgi:hypothetical protein